MTPEQKDTFENHLKENYGEMKCDGCGSRSWMIKEDFYMIPAVDPETLDVRMNLHSDTPTAEGLLAAIMVCTQCKRMVTISITDMPEIQPPQVGEQEERHAEQERA